MTCDCCNFVQAVTSIFHHSSSGTFYFVICISLTEICFLRDCSHEVAQWIFKGALPFNPFYPYLRGISGGSRISRRGGVDLVGGGVDSRGGYVSKILYVKTKELGPFPLVAPMGMHKKVSHLKLFYFVLNLSTGLLLLEKRLLHLQDHQTFNINLTCNILYCLELNMSFEQNR